jgi:exosortase/archaeosortase family protein
MKHFIPKYILLLLFLFLLFYYETTPVARWINNSQIDAIVFLMQMSLEPFQVVGRKILIHENYTLVVTAACNGMVPLWMLYASILALKSPWLHKLKWMAIGYVTLFVVNVLRIWFVAFATQEMGEALFFFAHDLAGNILLILTGMVLFMFYLKGLSKAKNF